MSEGRRVVSSLQAASSLKDQTKVEIQPRFPGPSFLEVLFSIAELSCLRLHMVRNVLPVGSWRIQARQAGKMRPGESRMSDARGERCCLSTATPSQHELG